MKASTPALLAMIVMAAVAGPRAQAPTASTAPLTNAALRAKVAALEAEISGLQADIKMLAISCQANAAAPPATPDPTTTDSSARAEASRQQLELDTFNRTEQARQQQQLDDASWYIKVLDYGPTESNRVFIRYAWKIQIKNGLDRTQAYDLAVQFLDSSGLVVDTARVYNQTVAAFDETILTGDKLVSMPGAVRVASIKAVASRKTR